MLSHADEPELIALSQPVLAGPNGELPPMPQKLQRPTRSNFPAVYDPRTTGTATSVRNQGELGLCWAYSGTDVLATANMVQLGRKVTYSSNYFNYLFAEAHLVMAGILMHKLQEELRE